MEIYVRRKLRAVEEKLAGVKEKMKCLRREERALISERTELELKLKETHEATSSAFKKEDWCREKFPWSPRVRELLSSFNLTEFRPFQLESINVILSGHDLLLIMPTGGGKSLCYQIPGLVKRGVCLVVSPLLSLMEDQTLSLSRHGINSQFLSADTSKEVANTVHRELSDPDSSLKFLFVTPERVGKSKKLISCLEKAYEQSLLSLIVVDEIHCASQWGHDFRPDYKKLSIFKLQFPSVPILGLTATATSQVLRDVEEILSLASPRLFRAGFNRRNLFYEVRAKPDQFQKQVDALVQLIASEFSGECGIIYCLSKRDCENISLKLRECGLLAACYHADVPPEVRKEVHHRWLIGKVLIVIATVAFGLGIDKKNVRFVIHHSLAKSLANYYQECGRAGRDGESARCILLYRPQDYFSHSCMVMTERTGLRNLDAIARYCQDVTTCRRVLISQHFNEPFQLGDCNDMCDNCFVQHNASSTLLTTETSAPSLAIARIFKSLIEVVEVATLRKERLTASKLLTTWKKQFKSEGKLVSNFVCMCMILQGLLDGIFREDYHFTPYSTISYLLVGSYADTVLSGNYQPAQCHFDEFDIRETNREKLVPFIRAHLTKLSLDSCSYSNLHSSLYLPRSKSIIISASTSDSDSEEDCKFRSKKFCPEQSVIHCDD